MPGGKFIWHKATVKPQTFSRYLSELDKYLLSELNFHCIFGTLIAYLELTNSIFP